MAKKIKVSHLKLFLLGFSLSLSLQPYHSAYANTTISSSPANTGNYTLNDAGFITVDANITQTNGDGSGGIINLTAGTIITVNNGRTLDVSATVAGKNGGTISFSAPAILINGTLKANGNGTGQGGIINLTGVGGAAAGSNYIKIGGNGIVQARGGGGGGLGGVINIIGGTNTYVNIANGGIVQSDGGYAAGANEIYIQGDGTENAGVAINNSGDIDASGRNGNDAGGLIRFTATDGSIKAASTSNILANGVGSGAGGSVQFLMANGAGAVDINSTTYFDFSTSSSIDLSNGGGSRSGSVVFGRSTAGTMSMNLTSNNNEFTDVLDVKIGNFTNSNVSSITTTNYNQGNFMNGGTQINFNATGNITANSGDRINKVTAASTAGGNINIKDNSGSMTVTSISTSGTTTLNASAGTLTVQGANLTGPTILEAKTNITASDVTNFFGGTVSAYGDAGAADTAGTVTIRSTGGLTVNSLNTTNTTTLNAAGGNLTISNATITNTATLTATGTITGVTTTNFGSSTSATSSGGGAITLDDSTGNFTLSSVSTTGAATLTASNGALTISSATVGGNLTAIAGDPGTSWALTLSNATVTGNTVLQSGNNITATASNNFVGTVQAYGESGTADYAGVVLITDNSGDLTLDRLTATSGTITAAAANSNLVATAISLNNGAVDLVAPKNISVSSSTIDGTDTLRLTSTANGDITLASNTLTSITGTTAAPVGSGGLRFGTGTGNVTLTSNTVSGSTAIASVGTPMQGNITGTGNTFTGVTNFYVNTGTKDISLTTSDFQSATNVFSGRNVTVSDNTNALTISTVIATNLTATASGSGAASDLTITNANVSGASSLTAQSDLTANSGTNTNFGTITATGGASGGNLQIAETTSMTISSITNNAATGFVTLSSSGGSVTGNQNATTDITSAGTGGVTMSAFGGYIDMKLSAGGGVNAYANGINGTGDSVVLRGTIAGNLLAQSTAAANTPGDIILGDWNTSRTLDVTGTTTFKSATDVNGYGTFTGAIAGNGARVDWWQIGATNLTVGDVTATATATGANEIFAGYLNVLNLYVPDASIVENGDAGSVDLTAANGGITLWAGDTSAKTGSYIRTGISTGGDVYMWAAGDSLGNGTGTSINVQTGNITGKVVAVDETWAKTNGDITINLTSGNLTTRDVGSNRNITLAALNGSVLQSNDYAFARNITVYSTGNTTIQAGDNGAVDTGSYIDTGVYVMGDAVFIAAGKSGTSTSVQVVGQIDGTTIVKNEAAAGVKGDVYLGTGIGDPDILNDTDGVLDTYGSVNVNALGNVYMNGGVALNGDITVTGNTLTVRQDIGRTKIASITTTQAAGTAVDIWNYGNEMIIGDLIGTDITTAGLSSILLKTGNAYPSDANAYIKDLSVNTSGDLTVYVAGDSNGTSAGGVSVNITGTVGGTSAAYNESGGATTGSVTMP